MQIARLSVPGCAPISGTDADREAFRSWVRSNFRPMMAKIGWEPAAGETDDTHTLRSDLFELLGDVGEDPETIRRATELSRKYLRDPSAVDPSIAREVLFI